MLDEAFCFLLICLKDKSSLLWKQRFLCGLYFSEDNSEMVMTTALFGLDGGTNHNNVQMKASGSAHCVWKPKLWRSHVDAH